MNRAEFYEFQKEQTLNRAEMFERLLAIPAYREFLDYLEHEAKLRLEELLLDVEQRPNRVSDAYLKGQINGLRWPALMGAANILEAKQLTSEDEDGNDVDGQ